MKRDYVGEIALADKAVKKITELFHLQETKDWEIKAINVLIDYKYPGCEHEWVRTTKDYKRVIKCLRCGKIR